MHTQSRSLALTLAAALLIFSAPPASAHEVAMPGAAVNAGQMLDSVANGAHRSAENIARNKYRHPVETLTFFGLRPAMTVVEISPGGGGWYTEILAPYLKDHGKLYAGSYDPEGSEYSQRNAKRYNDKLAANPELYGDVVVGVFAPPDHLEAAPAGSADLVVTFRNFHGWLGGGNEKAALEAMYSYLKPGGVLGFVQHRGDPTKDQDPKASSGYVREDLVISLAEAAGFVLDAKSEINANPKDTRNHPDGVWNLPPGFRAKDVDRAKYEAIGESDRMTLRFRKPK